MSANGKLNGKAASPQANQKAKRIGQAMMKLDGFSRELGMSIIEHGPQHARVQMTITDKMTNGHDICHGGLIFTLADSALAFACNAAGVKAVTAAAQIDFINPAYLGDRLTAYARVYLTQGRHIYCDVTVRQQDQTIIAECRGRQVGVSNWDM
ncbi:hydroxyphenylacetyl-CoA thioesterase PaaI [Shewanella corallii]|uniref:Hydroxyphenylacetyl-CoA thioesterase PaaI n=1 Tax=Shewanella corallii TaxID=560080 RepID=A0ABT0N552_9GAMM|nr:hydroxyphenylacetyl-CoA thioesterase PaaI [Shewanella corallii]MCL2913280.1 hydroxyphenylacetyl-CoA thioesterase PaaI [Shewanella corallii]